MDSKVVAEKVFTESLIGMVCDTTGSDVSHRNKGVVVKLYARDNKPPHFAEVYDSETEGEDFYAEIGLIWEREHIVGLGCEVTNLIDYDGVSDMPSEVFELLNSLGYRTKDMED